jgi:Na+/H+ antiporter NhaD/arsenite permease-like protein
MLSPTLAHLLLSLIVGLSIALMLVRPRNIPEVCWIGGGVVLLLVLRLVSLPLAGRAIAEALDVCLFLKTYGLGSSNFTLGTEPFLLFDRFIRICAAVNMGRSFSAHTSGCEVP